jgi:D-serine deaminase-like pyridoxal phosphate-dependent protein
MRVHELPTPALLLDADLFEANLRRMSEHMARAGKKLRPHAKAHKCPAIAKRQIEVGAVGVCVATVSEAELMSRSGIGNLLLTSPVADAGKCARVAAIAQTTGQVSVVVDHRAQVRLYSDAAKHFGIRLNVLVDLDLGDHRTGVAPGHPAFELARCVSDNSALRFAGLQAYSVRASHMSAAEGVADYSGAALQQAFETKKLLEENGVGVEEITGGSTGTYAVDSELPYMTELQAGSYALMDVAYARIGLNEFQHAMTVMATVVSANQTDRVTIDAGFKAFATDRTFGPDIVGLPGSRHQWAGDEFSTVFVEEAELRPQVGDRLRFLPPHCDPTVNLYDRMYVCHGDEVVDVWSIMGRYDAR